MSAYKYSAISRDGQRVTGVIEGFNEFDAAERIRKTCDIVLKLTPVIDRDEEGGFWSREIGSARPDARALTLMCSQFAIILRAGVPIGRAVQLIGEKTTDRQLKKILRGVAQDVQAGRSLSGSFTERGENKLPPTFIETIRAGEESGNLDRSFESMSRHYEKQTRIMGKVRGAMIYPAFVLMIAVAVVAVLMVKVVPTFTATFQDLGAELPGMTALFLVLKLYGNTEEGRINLAKRQLKLPVLGNIARLNAASQYSNTMAMMLEAGLPISRAVSITAKVMDNYFVGESVGKISRRLEEGAMLGTSLREADCLPDILVDMNMVGEETGELERTLNTIAGYYDSELEQATADALAKLEPAILCVLALVAGFIVISMYMAMFSMYNAM